MWPHLSSCIMVALNNDDETECDVSVLWLAWLVLMVKLRWCASFVVIYMWYKDIFVKIWNSDVTLKARYINNVPEYKCCFSVSAFVNVFVYMSLILLNCQQRHKNTANKVWTCTEDTETIVKIYPSDICYYYTSRRTKTHNSPLLVDLLLWF